MLNCFVLFHSVSFHGEGMFDARMYQFVEMGNYESYYLVDMWSKNTVQCVHYSSHVGELDAAGSITPLCIVTVLRVFGKLQRVDTVKVTNYYCCVFGNIKFEISRISSFLSYSIVFLFNLNSERDMKRSKDMHISSIRIQYLSRRNDEVLFNFWFDV